MKRITALVGSFCLVALFSCKKDDVTPVTDLSKTKSIENHAISFATVVQDTIPPSNAVDVKTYGATGNGYTDDTRALQNAINAQNVIVLKGGTYIINQTLTLRSGVKIYGTNGATIKSGTSTSGTLLTCGRYIYVNGGTGGSIVNLNFAQGSKAFSLGAWANSCIYINNSVNATIKYNRFNFTQPYTSVGIEGIWVSGSLSKNTYIGYNTLNTVGIEYAESGASGTVTTRNTVNNAHSNAISAHGNTSVYSTGCQVLSNIVNNAGYNGINDWGNMDGTLISGNLVNGSGKSTTEGSEGEGIQAVGVNTVVVYNTIKDAQAEYIEVKSTNKNISFNTIVDTKGITEGIVVNCMSPAQAHATASVATINHNSITGCSHAVIVLGNNTPNVNITSNSINNPFSTGININSNAPSYTITASGNMLNLTTRNIGTRKAITSYAGTLTANQRFNVTSNTITYTSGAAGGKGGEYAILPCTNNANLTGNKVITNNIKAGNNYVVALTANGSKYTGYTISNNTFTGSVVYDITGFISALVSGNVL